MFSKINRTLVGLAAAVVAALGLTATSALAAPVTWTVPATTMTNGGVISGTFVYDSALANPLVSVNIVETGPTPATYAFVGGRSGPGNHYHYGQESAAAVLHTSRAIAINLSALPTGGGVYTSSAIYTEVCLFESAGRCDGIIGSNSAFNVPLSAPTPASVPTLSEWSMILLALMLAGGAAVMLQRRRLAA